MSGTSRHSIGVVRGTGGIERGVFILVAVLVTAVVASSALAQTGTRTTPDGKQVLISKDVGDQRWAISLNLNDDTVTGNVFSPDGGAPQFVWCERTGDDGSLDAGTGEIQFLCRGTSACEASPCLATNWDEIGEVGLPGSFFLPAEDPFSPLRTSENFCDSECHVAEFLTVDQFSYAIESQRCNYVTVVQPTLRAISPGDELLVDMWHFELTSPRNARALMAVQVGDRIIWQAKHPIPCDGGLVGFINDDGVLTDCFDEEAGASPPGLEVDGRMFVSDFGAEAGTPIYFHMQNHGQNSYNLLGITTNGLSLIDHNEWREVSRGQATVPPFGLPLGPDVCAPENRSPFG